MTQLKLKEWIRYDKDNGLFYRAKVKKMDHKNNVGDIVANNIRSGYLRINVDGKLYSSHILAWLYTYGTMPTMTIDHKDRNKLNNKINNLRDVSQSINKINQDVNTRNKSGVTGVYWKSSSSRWIATITPEKSKRIFLGSFINKHEAVYSRHEAEQKYFSPIL